MKQIINDFINSIDTKLYSRIRASEGDAECRRCLKEHLQEQLTTHSVSKRYQVTDIQLADWESVTIGDTETNKVVCHFLTENGFDEAVKMANKIADYLNVS